MTSHSGFSAQTLAVLAALSAQPSQWRHGYEMASETALKSGTLYPILIRLSDRGLLESRWQDEPAPGRPRRHMYRLTPDGLAAATAALGDAAAVERAAPAARIRAAQPTRMRRAPAPRPLPGAG